LFLLFGTAVIHEFTGKHCYLKSEFFAPWHTLENKVTGYFVHTALCLYQSTILCGENPVVNWCSCLGLDYKRHIICIYLYIPQGEG
jgi:hypothetical protein